ncbi:hypothetical protein AGABI1DRAFT_134800 [Agaricus bisporus var. burnettii JB137-S8]|uniref:BTB domain-containing protein n=2 Tax=Agaricus bisporus var. burnettii TaxID=192524 RepID=K5WRP6_AGABU|nr:uncharacterized protein AGABI1DRAFT_134800 [Agaricus bisporus var. burnettii JB137-S8]EKM73423.1 hypothetical protein AGABI1DRAFT_134800 [Agaricus bisporus var. burnettii JB137-S8]
MILGYHNHLWKMQKKHSPNIEQNFLMENYKSNLKAIQPFHSFIHHNMQATTESFTSVPEDLIIRGADIVFMTDDGAKFHVHAYFFTRESVYWQQKLTGHNKPHHPLSKRYTPNDPYIIQDVDSRDLRKFLRVFYNTRYGDYSFFSKFDWIDILSIAHKWEFPQVKTLSKRYLGTMGYGVVERTCGVHCTRIVDDEMIDRSYPNQVYLISCGHEI